ncbi:PilZ domain-containing protein [Aestuariibius insulae]|uniref:PilZ domain-containing protein n=1 Tax=Aestuariibius insulae TaxID=2058287 RepID=UPI00345EDC45
MNFRDRRLPCRFDVAVNTSAGATSAQILNVTRKGARVAGLPLQKQGDEVSLKILHRDVKATVMWQTGEVTGIAFKDMLDLRQFDAIRKPRAVRTTSRKVRKVHSFQEIG